MCSTKIKVKTKKEVDRRHREVGIPRMVEGDTRKMVSVPGGTEALEQIRKLQETLLQGDEMNGISHVLKDSRRDLDHCSKTGIRLVINTQKTK